MISFFLPTCWLCAQQDRNGTTRSCMDSLQPHGSSSWKTVKIRKENLSLLFPNGQVYAVIFVNDSTIMNQKYGHGTMAGSVFVHLMRNRDDLCIIVKWECAKRTQSFITRAVVFFCCTNQISSRFCLSDCSQTIYLLIELQVKGESQKLLFSDTFVAAQTFSVDELLVTRLALQ